MKKRVLIAVALVVALVLIAQTGVWAGKLAAGSEAPVAAPGEAGARPVGTDGSNYVPTGPNTGVLPFVPPAAPAAPSVDVCESTFEGAPEGAEFLCVEFGEANTMQEDVIVVVELLGNDGGTVHYWDGSEWVELEVSDANEVTIPAGAPNPTTLAVVSN